VTLVSPQPRHAHIFPRAAHEHCVEPAWPSTRKDFGPASSVILDPGCAWGRILRVATDAPVPPIRRWRAGRTPERLQVIRGIVTAYEGD
jgi:hypothetical protein